MAELNRAATGAAIASYLGTVLHPSAIAGAALPVLMATISSQLGWSHAAIGAAMMVNYWGAAAGAAALGPLLDRLGPRRILIPSACLSALCLGLVGAAGGSKVAFYALLFLVGATMPGTAGYGKLLSTWFNRNRGLALGGLGVGMFLATIVTAPLTALAMTWLNWRQVFMVWGALSALIVVPAIALLARDGTVGGADDDAAAGGAAPVRSALTSRTFWLIALAQMSTVFVYSAFMTHAVGLLGERGLTPAEAVAAISVVGAGALIAQIVTGWLVDRLDTPRVVLPMAVLALVGLLLIRSATAPSAIMAGVGLLGLGCGGESSIISYFVGRYFGVANFSRVYGVLMPLLIFVAAPAPLIVGAIFDRVHSYGPALWIMEGALAITVVAMALLGPFRFPAQPTEPIHDAVSPHDLPSREAVA
jgi:MFS family permease